MINKDKLMTQYKPGYLVGLILPHKIFSFKPDVGSLRVIYVGLLVVYKIRYKFSQS